MTRASANPGAGLDRRRSWLPEINLKRQEEIAAWLFLAPFLVFFVIFVGRAILAAVQMSFHDWHALRPSRPFVGF